MTNNEKLFRQKVEKLTKVYVAKNKDYGDSFSLSLDKYGILASLIRMGDKMNRIDSLYDKPTTEVDESLVDSLEDLANYAIMTAIWLEKQVGDIRKHVRHWDDDEDDDYDDIDALLYALSDIGSEDDESEDETYNFYSDGEPKFIIRPRSEGEISDDDDDDFWDILRSFL